MIAVITLPYAVAHEAEHICSLLLSGRADLLHVRKPDASADELQRLLREVLSCGDRLGLDVARRLVLHDHHALASLFSLYGIHLNRRHPHPPVHWQGSVSRSCHSIDELAAWKGRCDYLSLSPIFDSISKPDYPAAFTPAQLQQAHAQGIIDASVLALGGVTYARLPLVAQLGFGGAMILGDAWRSFL